MLTALFSKLKLDVGQSLLLLGAAIITGLAALLKYKEAELHTTKVSLLKSHFENAQALQDMQIAQSAAKVQTSKERYEASMAYLNSLSSK
jgi:hypothetical protein